LSNDKTEQPTVRRQRQARRDGDVPVSAALTQTAGLLVAVALLPGLAHAVGQTMSREIRAAATRGVAMDSDAILSWVWQTLVLLGPFLLAVAGTSLLVGAVQTGGLISFKKLAPDLAQLNPVEGVKRLVSADRIFQLLRALVLMLLVGWLSFRLLKNHLGSAAASVGQLESGLGLAGVLSLRLLWLATLAALGMALLDLLVVRRSWLQRLRMSRDEVKREHREAEGDPQLKQERKRAHQQMLQGATLNAIKNASVVIVNPTHYATALFYDEDSTAAPQVVAQGSDFLARQIIDAARAYGVPIVRDVPVARALHELEVGEEIPEVLYEAVAEILRQVYSESELTPAASALGTR
jgi:flagellar biosynthesis protein FlhB